MTLIGHIAGNGLAIIYLEPRGEREVVLNKENVEWKVKGRANLQVQKKDNLGIERRTPYTHMNTAFPAWMIQKELPSFIILRRKDRR